MSNKIFGFISQFMGLDTVKYLAPHLLKGVDPDDSMAIEKILLDSESFIATWIKGKTPTGVPIEGAFAFVPLLAEYLTRLDHPVSRSVYLPKIREAVNKLADRGASIVGLGSLTGSGITGGGKLVRPVNTFLTTGNTFAAVSSVMAVEKAFALTDRKFDNGNFVVLGATGSIGTAISHELARMISGDAKLLLIARHETPLKGLCAEIAHPEVKYSTDIEAGIRQADVLMVTTAAHDCIVHCDMPKSGAIIVDDTKPWNCDFRLRDREDVLHIDGGLISVPGIDFGMPMDCPQGTIYACLVETIILWLRAIEEDYFLGKVPPSQLPVMREWAQEYGFNLAPFYSFNEMIPEDFYENFSRIHNR